MLVCVVQVSLFKVFPPSFGGLALIKFVLCFVSVVFVQLRENLNVSHTCRFSVCNNFNEHLNLSHNLPSWLWLHPFETLFLRWTPACYTTTVGGSPDRHHPPLSNVSIQTHASSTRCFIAIYHLSLISA